MVSKKKKTATKGNMLIAQSGGPTRVINESLVGAVLEAKHQSKVGRIIGSLHGISGILEENMIDLKKESNANLEKVALTPSSALGTVRKKPTVEDCKYIFQILHKYNVRYFFYIGGNDSAETTHIINQQANSGGYDLRCFHIPKTIDNDLRENDHTPGFGSAAKFVASAFMGDNLDNRALPGVKINVVMGRHAGFLTAASALARVYPDDGPHLIYLPERSFDIDSFTKDVQTVYNRLGRCVIAVSEGVVNDKHVPIAAAYTAEVDSHGNVQLSGTGALGDLLVGMLKKKTNISRVRADTLGYLQRSFPGIISEVDALEARQAGIFAVKQAVRRNIDMSVAIKRKDQKKYSSYLECVPLKKVARETRSMPASYINKAGNDVTKKFIDYVRPLVGDLPPIGQLKGVPIKKK